MKNKLYDLNNHLFAQIERLTEEDLKGEALKSEVLRSRAVSILAQTVINNAELALNAEIALKERRADNVPKMIESD